MMRNIVILLLWAAATGGYAGGAVASETEACLACHADKGHAVAFPQGGHIEAFVDEGKFKASVHSFLACTDCHEREFTSAGHEHRSFRSEEFFKLRYSQICRRCHLDEELAGTAVHVELLQHEAEGHAPICTDCHPAHAVAPTPGGRILIDEESHCLACHPDAAQKPMQAGPVAGKPRPRAAAHGNLSCSGCHSGFSRKAHPQQTLAEIGQGLVKPDDLCRRCHFDKYTRSLEGIHYDMQVRGTPDTPGCVDCHGSHHIVNLSEDRAASAGKCGECHPKLHRTYAASVHGDAMSNAHNLDVPVCTDCHKVHDINNPLAADYRDQIPGICGNCHADSAVMGKYGLSTQVQKTYLEDFHGSTVSIYLGQDPGAYRPERPIAVCTDCHGTHDIKSMNAVGAAQMKDMLVEKCRVCHARVGGDFPDAWLSHYVPSLAVTPALFVVDRAYVVLLPLLLAGMLLQVLLHAWRHATARTGAAKAAEASPGRSDRERIPRFSPARRVEHLILLLLFVTLAATGLAQTFHHADTARQLIYAVGGIDVLRSIHHWAGVTLVALLVLHVVVAVTGIAARGWRPSMLVSLQDWRDVAQNVRFYLGLAANPAACDRYDYKQKFTYWAVLVGIALMALTGFMLWFPMETAGLLPAPIIPLAASLHSHYALVILLVVAVWHVYDSVFSPDVFPLNTSIFTGTLSRRRMRALHPRELQRLDGDEPGSPG